MDIQASGDTVSALHLLTVATSLVAGLFALLMVLLGWLGNKIVSRLDVLYDAMHVLEGNTNAKITCLDRRVTKVETIISYGEHASHGN